jgi:outer membrane lipoprotein-sorting protein
MERNNLTRYHSLALSAGLIAIAVAACGVNVEKPMETSLPDDLPLPQDIRAVKSNATASAMFVTFLFDGELEALHGSVDQGLRDHGWKVEHFQISDEGYVNGVATKGPRLLFIHAVFHPINRTLSCTFDVTDSSIEHCDPTAAENPTANEAARVLEQLRSTYREARSYRDRGTRRTEFITSGPGAHKTSLDYATAFVRPDKFRFEYVEESERYIVYQSGTDIRSYWSLTDQREQFDSLNHAVAGPTGVSGGTVSLAADLLGLLRQTDVVTEMRDAIMLPEETVDGKLCYVVHGYDRRCQRITLWISKIDYLLVKMQENTLFADMETVAVTTIEPVLNADLSEDELAYNERGVLEK